MPDIYVLYNPLAGDGEEDARILEVILSESAFFLDITRITRYAAFLHGMNPDDRLIIAGGDGTLNRFINDTAEISIPQEIFYFPMGGTNDFALSCGKESFSVPFSVTEYLKRLPAMELNGTSIYFLTGIGFGLDGCCRQAEQKRRRLPEKKKSYLAIAAKCLLRYSPCNAKITVDGRQYIYSKVWCAPTMFGKHYCGGLSPAPEQDSSDPERPLSVAVLHGCSKLRALQALSDLFKGTQRQTNRSVSLLTGQEITVEFDRSTTLQVDGEIFEHVTRYTAQSVGCNAKTPVKKEHPIFQI